MKLTRASTYAIHAVTYMASQETNPPVPSHHIAKEQGFPNGSW